MRAVRCGAVRVRAWEQGKVQRRTVLDHNHTAGSQKDPTLFVVYTCTTKSGRVGPAVSKGGRSVQQEQELEPELEQEQGGIRSKVAGCVHIGKGSRALTRQRQDRSRIVLVRSGAWRGWCGSPDRRPFDNVGYWHAYTQRSLGTSDSEPPALLTALDFRSCVSQGQRQLNLGRCTQPAVLNLGLSEVGVQCRSAGS